LTYLLESAPTINISIMLDHHGDRKLTYAIPAGTPPSVP
jgi:hypothetical protein